MKTLSKWDVIDFALIVALFILVMMLFLYMRSYTIQTQYYRRIISERLTQIEVETAEIERKNEEITEGINELNRLLREEKPPKE